MKKKKAQPTARTMETAGSKSQPVERQDKEKPEEEETIHNGSANAFQAAEGIPVDDDEEEDAPRDDNY